MADVFATTGIMTRRVAYGDHDLILTLFTRDRGKMAVIAKNAKKSRKRFAGVLELFSELSVTCRRSRRGGMAVLQEAALKRPFDNIRGDIHRTAYASYWVELINVWLEDGDVQTDIYALLSHVLGGLDARLRDPSDLSIVFQLRFLSLSGMSPGIDQCHRCRKTVDTLAADSLAFSLTRGSVVCGDCRDAGERHLPISRGTVKLLQWVRSGALARAGRIRWDAGARSQGLTLLEAFVPYQLGKELKSLTFLNQIRHGQP